MNDQKPPSIVMGKKFHKITDRIDGRTGRVIKREEETAEGKSIMEQRKEARAKRLGLK